MKVEVRGRSILKKQMTNTATGAIPRQRHTTDDVPSGVGSPLARHPGNRVPTGDFRVRMRYQVELEKFQAHAKACYDEYKKLKEMYPKH